MSFKKIKFTYTPPLTIPSVTPTEEVPSVPVPVSQTPVTGAAPPSGVLTKPTPSRAQELIDRYSDLSITAGYLKDVVYNLADGVGININLAANPELGMALSRLYEADPPPEAVDMKMYKNLLAADMAVKRTELSMSADSEITVIPIQKADLALVTGTFESGMANSDTFKGQIALLPREMEGDQLIWDSLVENLKQYPVIRNQGSDDQLLSTGAGTNAKNDVSPEMAQRLNDVASQVEKSYGSTWDVLLRPGVIEAQAIGLFNEYLGKTYTEIVMTLDLLQTLTQLSFVSDAKKLTSSFNFIIMPTLIAEVFGYGTIIDRIFLVMEAPMKFLSGPLNKAFSKIKTPWLRSMLGQSMAVSIQSVLSVVDEELEQKRMKDAGFDPATTSISMDAINKSAAYLYWGALEQKNEKDRIQNAMDALMARRMSERTARLEMLSAMRAVSALRNLISVFKSGTGGKPKGYQPGMSNVQAFEEAMKVSKPDTGVKYAVESDNQTIQIIPPEVPAPPQGAVNSLGNAGYDVIKYTDMLKQYMH
jgi:hypothetical protein